MKLKLRNIWENGYKVGYGTALFVWAAGLVVNLFAALLLSGVAAVCVVGIGSVGQAGVVICDHRIMTLTTALQRTLAGLALFVVQIILIGALFWIGLTDNIWKAQRTQEPCECVELSAADPAP